jgi:hypothetical protein
VNSCIKDILDSKSILKAKTLARKGIPSGSRAQIWDLILQTDFVDDLKAYGSEYCKSLTESVAATELVYDRLLLVDVKHCQNDEAYFVFEEILNKIILFWSRDAWYMNRVNQTRTDSKKSQAIPPNGIYPIWGLSLYAMPICYIFKNVSCIYFTFRELYAR